MFAYVVFCLLLCVDDFVSVLCLLCCVAASLFMCGVVVFDADVDTGVVVVCVFVLFVLFFSIYLLLLCWGLVLLCLSFFSVCVLIGYVV